MEYKKMKNTIYLRIDKDESVIDTLQEVCRREKIPSGYFEGIGACDLAVLSTYIPERKAFTDHTISGMIEMISLMGNVSADDNNSPTLHCHGTFSFLDQDGTVTVTAGHLKDARISYTGEIILHVAEMKIGRMIDPKTGIEVWKLPQYEEYDKNVL